MLLGFTEHKNKIYYCSYLLFSYLDTGDFVQIVHADTTKVSKLVIYDEDEDRDESLFPPSG